MGRLTALRWVVAPHLWPGSEEAASCHGAGQSWVVTTLSTPGVMKTQCGTYQIRTRWWRMGHVPRAEEEGFEPSRGLHPLTV